MVLACTYSVHPIGGNRAPSGCPAGRVSYLEAFNRALPVLTHEPCARRQALVVIANHADVPVLRRERPNELVLGEVDVLVLIHQGVLELVLVVIASLGVLLQEADGEGDQVVEIEGAVGGELLLVEAVNA